MLALLLAVIAWSPSPVESVRNALFDTYQRLFPRERLSAPVTIVEIDEPTLAARGQWPWPRSMVAELISRIAEQRPAAIGLDLLFPEPDRFSPSAIAALVPALPADLAARLRSLPSNDALLAEAIHGRRVVLAIAGMDEHAPDSRLPLRQFAGYVASVPEIDRAAAGRGLISTASAERIVRSVPLVARVGERIVPALSLELLRVASGAPAIAVREAGNGLLQVAFADTTVPVQRDGTIWLRYSAHSAERFVSAAALFEGRVDAAMIRDKLVLVGVSGLGLLDYKLTPLGEEVPGVELHAQLIEQIFDGSYLTRPVWAAWLELAVLLVGGALLIWLVPAARVRSSVAVAFALLAVIAALGAGGFAVPGLLIDAAWPALGLAALFAALLAATLAEADRQRRQLREAAARAAGELEAARRIQMGLLPDPAALFASQRAFALRAVVHPALSVGGDFYDCFMLDEGLLFFAVADVSGKGMPAALFMALCKTTMKAAMVSSGRDPGAALQIAAGEIARDNPEAFFVTVFAGTLDLASGKLLYSNAGHEPPYVYQGGRLRRLASAPRPPLGVAQSIPFFTESLQLATGDWICAITDGVTEAMNIRGEFYGSARLEKLLNSLPGSASPSDVAAAVENDVKRFVGEASPSDDLTLLVLRASSGR